MLKPQLATLVASAPQQGSWLYELKFDGYRLMTRLEGDKVSCFTRNGHDWTDKLPQLARSLATLGLQQTWLDGEIVVAGADGIPDFQLLQAAFTGRGQRLAAGRPVASPLAAAIVYYVFDMPFYDGHDLRGVALTKRRALLQSLLKKVRAGNLRFSNAFDTPAKDLVTSACKLGFEGLIGKRADSPYQSRRSSDWIKLKCGQRQEFLICGFTEPNGSRSGFGALLLGIHDAKGKLQYAGKVGSGFNEKTLLDLGGRLDELKTETPPFGDQAVVKGRPHWVKAKLLAEVSFAEWTRGNRIRHGVFRGLRSDKAAQAITREHVVNPSELPTIPASTNKPNKPNEPKEVGKPAKLPLDAGTNGTKKRVVKVPPEAARKMPVAALPASLRISHPERVIDRHSGLTKLELVEFYALIAPLMIPHLKGRPTSLLRAPAGIGGAVFFQKHAKEGELPGVTLLDPALDPEHDSMLEISGISGMLSAAQLNTVEFHTWNAQASFIDKPDRMTFDLDPGDKLPWAKMQQAALLLHTLLEELGLAAFLKTSGGKGLHVVVPLKKQLGWGDVKGFSRHIATHLAKTIPQLFVARSGPDHRIGKIFVDYLRNGFGATTASAWTARARPGVGVSVPVAWDELAVLAGGAHWTVQTIAERIKTGNAPWAHYAQAAKPLANAMRAIGFKRT